MSAYSQKRTFRAQRRTPFATNKGDGKLADLDLEIMGHQKAGINVAEPRAYKP